MNLIENYLREVSRFLPAQERQDIVDELRDVIEEQVVSESGDRDPNEQDELSVLQRFGHPLKVASGYMPLKALIGPAIFPAYLHTLKIILVLALSLQLVMAFIAAAVAGYQVALSGVFAHLLETAFMVAAIVTAVFAVIEYSGEQLKWYDSWKASSLRAESVSVIKRGDVITNLITEGVFLLWWNDILIFQNWLPLDGEQFPVALASTWSQFFWPLNVIIGAMFALHVYVLARGLWQRNSLLAEITLGMALLAIAAGLLMGGDLVEYADTTGSLGVNLQHSARMGLLVVAGLIAWDVFVAVRLLRGKVAGASESSVVQ